MEYVFTEVCVEINCSYTLWYTKKNCDSGKYSLYCSFRPCLMGRNCDCGYNSLSCSVHRNIGVGTTYVCHRLVQFAMHNELYKRDCKIFSMFQTVKPDIY